MREVEPLQGGEGGMNNTAAESGEENVMFVSVRQTWAAAGGVPEMLSLEK